MDNLHHKFEYLAYWKQITLLFGVPIFIALLIYKFDPVISDTSLGLFIVIALWWLLVFGWLNFYSKKEKLRQFAIQITQLEPEEIEKLIKNVDIRLNENLKRNEVEEDIYPKADKFIDDVNRTSRYRTGIWD